MNRGWSRRRFFRGLALTSMVYPPVLYLGLTLGLGTGLFRMEMFILFVVGPILGWTAHSLWSYQRPRPQIFIAGKEISACPSDVELEKARSDAAS